MSDRFLLSDTQMARLEPFFPKSYGKPRVDDRWALSGIIFINRNGLRWRDAPAAHGPRKTLYNRCKRWNDKGFFARMMAGLAAERGEEKAVMIDATYLKAHRTATSLGGKKGAWPPDWSNQRRHEYQAAHHLRQMSHSAPLVQEQWRMTPVEPVRYGWASQRRHRRPRFAGPIAKGGMAARGPRLWC